MHPDGSGLSQLSYSVPPPQYNVTRALGETGYPLACETASPSQRASDAGAASKLSSNKMLLGPWGATPRLENSNATKCNEIEITDIIMIQP